MCGRRGEIASGSIVSSSCLKSGEASPHLSIILGVSSRCAEKSCGRHFACMSGEVSGSPTTQNKETMRFSCEARRTSIPSEGSWLDLKSTWAEEPLAVAFPTAIPLDPRPRTECGPARWTSPEQGSLHQD